MVFLYIIKVHVNEKFKEKLPVPVPVELILVLTVECFANFLTTKIWFYYNKVVVATVVSYFVNFSGRYNVKTIGFLPLG